MAREDGGDLIPQGTVVPMRLLGAERVGTAAAEFLYRGRFEVTGGPHKGKVAVRAMWHSPGGLRQMTADMVALGHAHPEEICGRLCREYPVLGRVGVGNGPGGERINTVESFEPAGRPAAGAATGAPPADGTGTDDAVASAAAGPSRPAKFTVYTDGGCEPNPGPGGWGAVVIGEDGGVTDHRGGEPRTTNNRMELTAAIGALRLLPPGSEVTVYTDSRYVRGGITSWVAGWRARGWAGVKNRDLWEQLSAECGRRRVEWEWVRGHDGDALNERADALATSGRLRQR